MLGGEVGECDMWGVCLCRSPNRVVGMVIGAKRCSRVTPVPETSPRALDYRRKGTPLSFFVLGIALVFEFFPTYVCPARTYILVCMAFFVYVGARKV